LQQRKIN